MFISLFIIIFFNIRFSNLNISERVFLNGGEDISKLISPFDLIFSGYVLCKDNHRQTQQLQQKLILTYILRCFCDYFPPKKGPELARKASMIDDS